MCFLEVEDKEDDPNQAKESSINALKVMRWSPFISIHNHRFEMRIITQQCWFPDRRPDSIIQDDIFTQSRINTVIVVSITANTQLAEAPGNVLLPREASGLPKDSVANVSQILTIDKTFLLERVEAPPKHLQQEVDEGLRTILYL